MPVSRTYVDLEALGPLHEVLSRFGFAREAVLQETAPTAADMLRRAPDQLKYVKPITSDQVISPEFNEWLFSKFS